MLFQRYFFECLGKIFEEKNTFIIDRGEEPEVALFNQPSINCNIVEIIHADHLGDRVVPSAPLWNNYYEYLLTHLEQVDRIVVATELQRQDFLIDFPSLDKKFVSIPVGGINNRESLKLDLSTVKKRPAKFMTASRLASEKHVDFAIQAIALAHNDYPEISFDIYGQGTEEGKLRELIDKLGAAEYIHLKGHSNKLDEVYKEYDAFISASYSEGFGLTYIEALDAGLPIVTFKARFGALELIKDSKNGFLKDFSRDDENFNVTELLDGIHQLLKSNYPKLKESTFASVAQFQDDIIANKWRIMLDEL